MQSIFDRLKNYADDEPDPSALVYNYNKVLTTKKDHLFENKGCAFLKDIKTLF